MQLALQAQDAQARERGLSALHGYVSRILGRAFRGQLGEADLEDLTQESVLNVLQRLDTFKGQSRFTTWVAVIATHQGVSELRRRRLQRVTLEAAAAVAAAALASQPGSETSDPGLDALQRGLQESLTPRQREALLARLGGVPLMEIARRNKTSPGAVYKMIHDARLRLRAYLDPADVATPRGARLP